MKLNSVELIKKIERCNLSKDNKKQLIENLNKGGYDSFLKRLYYIISIGDNVLEVFDVGIEDIFEEILKL